MNMQVAGLAAKELGAEIKVIKRSSPEYAAEKDPPPCPSVMVNGRFLARNDVVTYEMLKGAMEMHGATPNAGAAIAAPA